MRNTVGVDTNIVFINLTVSTFRVRGKVRVRVSVRVKVRVKVRITRVRGRIPVRVMNLLFINMTSSHRNMVYILSSKYGIRTYDTIMNIVNSISYS